jgi:hypothetical protein
MRKRLIFAVVLFIFCSKSTTFGQNLSIDDLLNPSIDLSNWTANGTRSSIFITQAGGANEAQIIQSLNVPPSVGQTNLVRVLQLGEENFVQITNKGQNNQTDVLQNGNLNRVVSNVTGARNVSSLLQTGNQNVIIQTLLNTQAVKTDFQQNGNNNRIEQEIISVNNLPVKLIQNGNGLNAIIRQGQ